MKTRNVLFTGAALALLLLPACSGDEPEYRTETTLLDSDTSLKEMAIGETRRFFAQEGETDGITWFSADTAVARVSADGTVTAVTAGETTISAGIDRRTVANYNLHVHPGYVKITETDGTSLVRYLAESQHDWNSTTDASGDSLTVHEFGFVAMDNRLYNYQFEIWLHVYLEGKDKLDPGAGDWKLFPATYKTCYYDDYRNKERIYLTLHEFACSKNDSGDYSISANATDEENRSVEMRYTGTPND